MTRPDELPPLSEAQHEIMNLVWDRQPCTVADVWQVLKERRGLARNTVQTLMARLAEKGWLWHEEGEGGFVYRAALPRDEVQRHSVRRMVDTVFDGSVEALVLTLMGGRTVSPEEAARIRQLIAKAGRQSR
jgi:predicted transcriptional regulator